MAAQRDRTGARPKVKEEAMDSFYAGAPGHEREFGRASEHSARLRQTVRELAAAAGFNSPSPQARVGSDVWADVNRDRGGQRDQLQVKTPKYSGKADWEAFHA